MKKKKYSKRYELRMLSLLAVIIAITSLGQFSLHGIELFGTKILPISIMQIVLIILF